jgi:hypothetical protein
VDCPSSLLWQQQTLPDTKRKKIDKKEVTNTVTVLFKAQNKDEFSVCFPLVYTSLWVVPCVCVYSIF